MKKWLWIGQRLSDGILYSRTLDGLDVFFSCDSLSLTTTSPSYFSLPVDKVFPSKQRYWASKDISKIVDNYFDEINKCLAIGYDIFSYYLSADSLERIHYVGDLFNRRVFNNQLGRSTQMYLCSLSDIRTPRWSIPRDMDWNDLAFLLGDVVVLQFDNTSSCMGTFVVHNENEYKWFCSSYGQPDLATEYLESGYPCSVHLWITKDSIIISPASIQIIEHINRRNDMGVQSFVFRGNDFGFYNQVIATNSDINSQLRKIGSIYQKAGIWGLIGVDYIVKDSRFYYTETNLRLQNSTSLLSFIQPIDKGNVVNCLQSGFSEFSNADFAYQYYIDVPATHLISGYYNKGGDFLGSITAPVPRVKENLLVFCSTPHNSQQILRIIGFEIGCDGNGTIKNELVSFLKDLTQSHF